MSLIYTAPAATTSNAKRNSIYLGSKADAKDRSKLERCGITHILNVTPEKEAGIKAGVPNYFEKNKMFTYRRIPVYDNATTNLIEYAPSIVSFISSALHYGSVLVHCQRGVSRSSACVIFYLMNKLAMSLQESLDLLKRCRPCAEPIPAFIEQLIRYEEECRSLGSNKKKGIIVDKSIDSTSEDGVFDNQQYCDKSSSKKKRQAESQGKRVLGPIRPIVGPSMPSSTDVKKKDKQSAGLIGPIGPSLSSLSDEKKKEIQAIGPMKPSMPPSSNTQTEYKVLKDDEK